MAFLLIVFAGWNVTGKPDLKSIYLRWACKVPDADGGAGEAYDQVCRRNVELASEDQ
jgi:hypothetical protein